MHLTKQDLKQSQNWLQDMTPDIEAWSDMCYVASNNNRIMIMLLLDRHRELCVGSLSDALQVSLSAVSHQLKMLDQHDLVEKDKRGQEVCYYLSKRGHGVLRIIKKI